MSTEIRRGALVVGLGAAALLVVALDAPLCPTATFLGVPCPGCGLTRASLALVRGDLAGAVRLHPLAPLLTPLCAALLGLAIVRFVRGSAPPPPRLPAWLVSAAAGGLVVLVLGLWIARFFGAFGGPVPVRSLPGAPFAQSATPAAAATR